jgi:protein-S-isoprenylcysteine O-methyltransferase Ste14
MDEPMTRIIDHAIVVSARVIGTVSLVSFTLFCYAGPFDVMDLGLEGFSVLVFDVALCLAFCLQHSVMIRKSFREKAVRFVPEPYHGACYTMASGLALLILVVFWQESLGIGLSLQGGYRLLARAVFFAALAGLVWGVRSLPSFDGFGVRPLRARLRGSEMRVAPLSIRGPYRWVRHPLYSFMLLLIWSGPDLTIDRILFNALMTGWMVVGTCLEERDLVDEFGDHYREYQRTVPMLIPWRIG